MKKCCILLIIANLICIGVLAFKGENRQTLGAKTTGVENPKIAITFDDGPNETWTPKLLEGLKKRGVKATFFVIGQKAESHSELIQKMYEEGHLIGNHTYSHVQLTTISKEEACQEIQKTCQVLYNITGEYPQFIRAPFGCWDEALECDVSLIPVKWNIDTLDWTTKNTVGIVNKAVSQAKDNGIILLHDNYESSVEAALQIIDKLQQQGYEFVTVEELLLD